MTSNAFMRAVATALLLAGASGAAAQSRSGDSDSMSMGDSEESDQRPGGAPQPGMMRGPGGRGMMMGGMGGMAGGPLMGGHMMKMMFAIADADGDGALSFDEVTALHQRIFVRIDADKNGKVTPEEARAFWRE